MAIVKSVRKETLRKEWRAVVYIFAQVILVLLLAYQIIQILGLKLFWAERHITFSIAAAPGEYILLALIIALLALIYLRMKKHQPRLFSAQEKLSHTIREALREKTRRGKDHRAVALMLIELMFVMVVVIAAYFFFEPNRELIPWSKVNIGPPLTTGLNAIVALTALVLFYWLYRYTAWYRK